MAYVSIVRSSLEFTSNIWDPGQAGHKSLLERVQRCAALWIKSDYERYFSKSAMLESLGLETLEERGRLSRLAFMYKVLHEEDAVPALEIDVKRNPRATRGLPTQDKLLVPRCSTNELKCHFTARTDPNGTDCLGLSPQSTKYPPSRVVRLCA